MPEVASPATGKTLGDSAEVHKACDELEAEIAELKANYEQYFLGVERKPPTKKHDALKRRMNVLRNTFVRQTAAKFRVQQIAQKLATYERLWSRTLKEMEEGTYKRDLFKAKLHKAEKAGEAKTKKVEAQANGHQSEDVDMADFDVDEDDAPSSTPPDAEAARGVQPGAKRGARPAPPQVAAKPNAASQTKLPPVAQGPAAPAPGKPTQASQTRLPAVGGKPAAAGSGSGPAVPAPGGAASGPGVRVPVTGPMAAKPSGPVKAPVAAQGDLSDQKVKAIYDAYVTAKKRCNEDVSKLSLDSLASTLRKQVPDLMKQHGAKSVEFKVVIKDGKAILRALPK